ncbi:hypothetical protein J5491_03505 [Candidatus Saccharibacteria bacterium]|nr:hypothetical protein [Candidatus Saccharibacteria bacterium]
MEKITIIKKDVTVGNVEEATKALEEFFVVVRSVHLSIVSGEGKFDLNTQLKLRIEGLPDEASYDEIFDQLYDLNDTYCCDDDLEVDDFTVVEKESGYNNEVIYTKSVALRDYPENCLSRSEDGAIVIAVGFRYKYTAEVYCDDPCPEEIDEETYYSNYYEGGTDYDEENKKYWKEMAAFGHDAESDIR